MNMAIWAFSCLALRYDYQPLAVRRGFSGLLEGDIVELGERESLRWARLGGTWLGSSRLHGFPERADELVAALRTRQVDGLLVLGGNGSLAGSALLAHRGVNVVGLPASIDNDIDGSDDSLGFDTAVNTALRLLDGIRDTAESIPRFFALETLGGDTGFLAQAVAEAGGADAVLIPEQPLSESELLDRLRNATARHGYALLVASEGYPELEHVLQRTSEALGTRLRLSRVGHAQRGGTPSAHDRRLAHRLVRAGLEALTRGVSGALLVRQGDARLVPFAEQPRRRPLEQHRSPL
jgi:6-phosphofructokinase 1